MPELVHGRINKVKLIIQEAELEPVHETAILDPSDLSIIETSSCELSFDVQDVLIVDPVQVAELGPEDFIPVLVKAVL